MSIRAVAVRAVCTAAAIVLAGLWGATAFAQGTKSRPLPRVYVFTQVAKPAAAHPSGTGGAPGLGRRTAR